MATLKERIDKAVTQFAISQKAKAATEKSARYNTTISELAKAQRELKNQGS